MTASTLFAFRPSTWSAMSDRSGDMTSVTPLDIKAGAWKQTLFPPPVYKDEAARKRRRENILVLERGLAGMIQMTSRPSRTAFKTPS